MVPKTNTHTHALEQQCVCVCERETGGSGPEAWCCSVSGGLHRRPLGERSSGLGETSGAAAAHTGRGQGRGRGLLIEKGRGLCPAVKERRAIASAVARREAQDSRGSAPKASRLQPFAHFSDWLRLHGRGHRGGSINTGAGTDSEPPEPACNHDRRRGGTLTSICTGGAPGRRLPPHRSAAKEASQV